jgi:hypothetical protein
MDKPNPFYHNEAIDLTDDPGLPNSRAIAIGLSRISEQMGYLIDLLAPQPEAEENKNPDDDVLVRLPDEYEPWDYIWYDPETGVPYGIKRDGTRVGVYNNATGKWRCWWPHTTDRNFRRVLGLEV